MKFYAYLIKFLIVVSSLSTAWGENLYYVVEKGDSLGTISHSIQTSQIWGKNRFVDKIIKLNNLNTEQILRIGTKILLVPINIMSLRDCNILIRDNRVFIKNKLKKEKIVCNNKKQTQIKKNHTEIHIMPSKKIKAKNDSVNKKSGLDVAFGFSFSKISFVDKSNNKKGQIVSKPQKVINLFWNHYFYDKTLKVLFLIKFQNLEFQESENRKIINYSSSNTRVGIGIEHKVFEETIYGVNISYGEDYFLYAPSTSLLTIESAQNFFGRTYIRKKVTLRKDMFVDISIGAEYRTQAKLSNQTSKTGFGYFAGLKYNQVLNDRFNVYIKSRYIKANKDTNVFDQKENLLSFTFGTKWTY